MEILATAVLRTIFTHKGLFKLTNPKCFPNPSLVSFRSLQNPQFSRHSLSVSRHHAEPEFPFDTPQEFRTNSTNPVSDSTSDGRKNKPTWTIYGHVASSPVPERVKVDSDDMDLEQTHGVQVQSNLSSSEDKAENSTREKAYRGVKELNPAQRIQLGGTVGAKIGRKKKGKGKTYWVCSNCGHTQGQWWGICPSCNTANTMTEFHEVKSSDADKVTGFLVSENAVGSWLPQQAGELRPVGLKEVNRGIKQTEWRIPLSGSFGNEVSTVLGGGLVPGCLVLVGGDPGVGKSTLLLQIAATIADRCERGEAAPVVYVSGEESVDQIGNRADRLGVESENLFLYSSTDIEDILEQIQCLSPRALVVDSIQTVYLKGVVGSAGGFMQVKECTSALLRFAKKTKIPVLLTGHVTKSGDIAGPRVLEHIVDVVLYMEHYGKAQAFSALSYLSLEEGEKCSSHRLLRSVKNRFGSTDELGVFEMSHSGLQAVPNASEMFLTEQNLDSEILAGLAVAVIMDGSRTFLIEIQALCVSASTVYRQVNGIQASRADMIISVLMKQAGIHLQENAVFLNVVSGLTLTETAGDLAVAAAICSSFLESPIPSGVAFIGEIGLGGELRMVPQMEKRVNTVGKLGYRMCIVPRAAVKAFENERLGNVKVVGCRNLKEVINILFSNHSTVK